MTLVNHTEGAGDEVQSLTFQARVMIVGLKLFSQVMLEHRKHPLFASLQGASGEFMKNLEKPLME